MYISCHGQTEDLQTFFEHKTIFGVRHMTKNDAMRHENKSDLFHC